MPCVCASVQKEAIRNKMKGGAIKKKDQAEGAASCQTDGRKDSGLLSDFPLSES